VNRAFLGNLLAYQLLWCTTVYGAAHGWWWLGFVVLVPFAYWQIGHGPARTADSWLVAGALVLGFTLDSVLAATGQLHYASPVPSTQWAPAWILALWIGFALTLNHSMAWFKGRLLIGSAIGFVAGPLAYWFAGRTWGAVQFADPAWPALLALAVAWAILMPLGSWWAERLHPTLPAGR